MSFEVGSLGILGGSFNPPHIGHVALARAALEELGLERVVLMPLHTSAHKPGGEDPGPEHRLEMCRLAVAGEPGVEASALEIERGGPSYTADTLEQIHADDPEAELTFIVGADTALTLPGWRRPEQVLGLARLAVAGRQGSDGAQVLDALEGIPMAGGALPHERPDVVFLTMAPVEASSSLARERIAEGRETGDLLAPVVAAYVVEHGLYGGRG
ncbi:MAG TPA: nicotinate (nicotinamide) nucleotide adenylyltransferase [Solirubrobacteraceae bacterium]|nr:nicotinate (nicotinamide) nucleotide adenylyltransferase [Solirubrobacteraceae bacterium]